MSQRVSVRAAMPWAFAMIVLVFGIGVVIFQALDPVVDTLIEQMEADANSDSAHYGIATVQTGWDYWPVWFLGILYVYGYVEAIRHSQRGGI